MLEFDQFDLRDDPQARQFVKTEVVEVVFAAANGEIASREGPNGYTRGDALLTSAAGDRWSVSRARFDAKYLPLKPLAAGTAGRYRNRPWPVLAKQIDETFSVTRTQGGDRLHGAAGDWLVQYAPGDYGLVEQTRFAQVYRRLDDTA